MSEWGSPIQGEIQFENRDARAAHESQLGALCVALYQTANRFLSYAASSCDTSNL